MRAAFPSFYGFRFYFTAHSLALGAFSRGDISSNSCYLRRVVTVPILYRLVHVSALRQCGVCKPNHKVTFQLLYVQLLQSKCTVCEKSLARVFLIPTYYVYGLLYTVICRVVIHTQFTDVQCILYSFIARRVLQSSKNYYIYRLRQDNCIPGLPGGPVAPRGPIIPPGGPRGPGAPADPGGPLGPLGPGNPLMPVAPVNPVAPRGPGGPEMCQRFYLQ